MSKPKRKRRPRILSTAQVAAMIDKPSRDVLRIAIDRKIIPLVDTGRSKTWDEQDLHKFRHGMMCE